MNIEIIKNNFIEAREILDAYINNEDNWIKLQQAGDIMLEAIKSGHKIISCGNGGSMCDAMHFAEELTGRFRDNRPPIAALSISDPSYMSCTANDYGYDFVFSRYIGAIGQNGDVLLAISTSGNSANIIKACESAKNKQMKIIGLTGKDGGKIAPLCDVELRAPMSKYADRVQEIHIKLIHSLIHYIELGLLGNK